MGFWTYTAIFLFLVSAFAIVPFLLGNPRFWQFVAKHPDQAIACFLDDKGWLVDVAPPPEVSSKYVGPFRVMDTRGKTHVIYGLEEGIEERQRLIVAKVSASR